MEHKLKNISKFVTKRRKKEVIIRPQSNQFSLLIQYAANKMPNGRKKKKRYTFRN